MKLSEFYRSVIKNGMARDPRGKKIMEYFKGVKKKYSKLTRQEKSVFDKEAFSNPYADTRVLYGRLDTEIKKILVGIDIETSELLLADRIREREGLDLVLAHHPEGIAYAGLHEVMEIHGYILGRLGIRKEAAEEFLNSRIQEVARRVSAANHARPVDAARLLDLPFMCCHTPADNFVAGYLQALLGRARPKRVKDVLNILYAIPEYRDAACLKAGPRLILGKAEGQAGKIFVDMTGGTEGPKELFGRISQAGIGTIVCMHLSEEHFSRAKPEHINVIVAGHIASDSLGLNLLLDRIASKEKLKIAGCSGFKRVKRDAA